MSLLRTTQAIYTSQQQPNINIPSKSDVLQYDKKVADFTYTDRYSPSRLYIPINLDYWISKKPWLQGIYDQQYNPETDYLLWIVIPPHWEEKHPNEVRVPLINDELYLFKNEIGAGKNPHGHVIDRSPDTNLQGKRRAVGWLILRTSIESTDP